MRILDPPRFLIDENLSPGIASGVLERNPATDILYIGGLDAPSRGTLDPDVLDFCEQERRVLVTNNRKSMPRHLAALQAMGRHHWGIFEVRDENAVGEIIEELLLIHGATDASEHIDRVRWIPE
jgi:hypothetical protein